MGMLFRVPARNVSEGGGPKDEGVWGEFCSQLKCLKWPILPEITAKYEIYFNFLYLQGGYPSLWF